MGAILFAATYLVGCFVGADFNIAHWDEGLRRGIGVTGGALFLVALVVTSDIMKG